MKNEKILMYMKLKGINQSKLSALTGIAPTTLSRIINGTVTNVKSVHMESIAKALGTTVSGIFDIPVISTAAALTPDEAGTEVEKLLSPNESLLLYWYQNSKKESQKAILLKARNEYYITQREINQKLESDPGLQETREEYQQLELPIK